MDAATIGDAESTLLADLGSPNASQLRVGDDELNRSSSILGETDDSTGERKRHNKYYLEDGDCTILVENTLFKIHRFLLARDSSAFEGMFSMPAEVDGGEGRSDDKPIVLPGEKAAHFKTLLNILYALPAELKQYETEFKHLNRLLMVAEMANKYHFTSTTTWALSAARAVTGCDERLRVEPTTAGNSKIRWCSPHALGRIIEVASLCGDDELRDHATWYWKHLIKARWTHPLYAIDIAERLGLSDFVGVCYYRLLQECSNKLELVEGLGQMRLDKPTAHHVTTTSQVLTAAHKARLLSGAFSLSNLWEDIRCNPPALPNTDNCAYHAQACTLSWDASWRGTTASVHTMSLRPFDLLGRMAAVRHSLELDHGLHIGLTPGCRNAALESVRALSTKVEEELAVHFVDLTKAGEVIASD